MSQKDLFDIPQSKVMYNAQGKPEFLLVPIKQSKVYEVSDEEIVSAIDGLRGELWKRYDAENAAATS